MGVILEKLPLEPLERRAFLESGLPPHDDEHCGCCDRVQGDNYSTENQHSSIGRCWSVRSFAHAVGQRSDKAIHRWREEGGLTHRAADKAATALGLHPSAIWAEW